MSYLKILERIDEIGEFSPFFNSWFIVAVREWACRAIEESVCTEVPLIVEGHALCYWLAHFIMPQYYIHQMLMKTKKEWLEQFSKKLSAKANEAFPAQPEIIFFVLGAF